MPNVSADSAVSGKLNTTFARAMGFAWPLQLAAVALWIAVPHPADSHPAALVVIAAAFCPLYLPLVLIRRPVLTRRVANIAMVIGVAQMSAMTWAGGGLSSGFELLPLWFVPVTVCLVPRLDVVIEIVAVIIGAGAAAVIESFTATSTVEGPMWGFAVVALATLGVVTGVTALVYGELQSVSERFRRRSVEDPLTDLANRSALSSYISQAWCEQPTGAAYVIDVDGFKLINDSLGHVAGDRLLVLLADRLRAHARAGDLLARTGGDEFVLIARAVCDARDTKALGQRLTEVCEQPFAFEGKEAHISVTVGAALIGDGETVEESLRNADLALYAAKAEQRGTARLFEARMREQAIRRLTIEHHLRRAFEREELRVVYQPIVSLQTLAIAGMEALLRWRTDELGEISPMQFIPAAERTGLILPVGRFVLTEAIAQLAAWRRRGHDITVAVNLSAGQLVDEQLPMVLTTLLKDHDVPGERLCLELTETALIAGSSTKPMAVLDRLRATGVQLALDDFGTGYSSLARFSELQLSAVKIDRSFIAQMLDRSGADAVVNAIMAMAEPLGIDVIAEGVETTKQLARLIDLRCRYAQGYLFARPIAPQDAGALLAGGTGVGVRAA